MAKNSKTSQKNTKKENIFKRLAENRYALFQYEILLFFLSYILLLFITFLLKCLSCFATGFLFLFGLFI